MAARALLLLLLVLGGCDGVLHLARVPDPSRDATGSGDDAVLDAKVGCSPAAFTRNTPALAGSLTSQGFAQNSVDVAIVTDNNGTLKYVHPVMSGSQVPLANGGSGRSYVAVQPTLVAGSSLFFYANATSMVYEMTYLGPNFDVWSGPNVTTLPPGVAPGAPAELSGGGLRMVVESGSELDEYERASPGSQWQQQPALTLTFADLGYTTGVISYPALTPDGHGLVYLYTDVGNPSGIYFTHRDSLDQKFPAPAMIYSGIYYSPVLAADCSGVYAVDATSRRLTWIH